MVVARSMHAQYLSNAFVVGEPGGAAVFVDSGAPLDPLLEAVERESLRPVAILRTHAHPDHVEHEDELAERFGIPVVTGAFDQDGIVAEAIPCPGHSDDGVSFLIGDLLFSGDTLFKDAVGGGPADVVRDSVRRLLELPPETRVLPGHTDETTIGREAIENPFVRFWNGSAEADGRRCRLGGEDGTVLVWSPDYDGKGKLLIRLDDGTERIVGASRVEFV